MLDEKDKLPKPSDKVITVNAIDVDAYWKLVDRGYWIGFIVQVPIKGGN